MSSPPALISPRHVQKDPKPAPKVPPLPSSLSPPNAPQPSRTQPTNTREKRQDVPSLTSSKQCPRSQCAVKINTRCPNSCNPTAASTIKRSAPPMPRSGWMKTMLYFFWGGGGFSKDGDNLGGGMFYGVVLKGCWVLGEEGKGFLV